MPEHEDLRVLTWTADDQLNDEDLLTGGPQRVQPGLSPGRGQRRVPGRGQARELAGERGPRLDEARVLRASLAMSTRRR